jgi:hypothetical protein
MHAMTVFLFIDRLSCVSLIMSLIPRSLSKGNCLNEEAI